MSAYYTERFNHSTFIHALSKELFGFYGRHLKEIRSKELKMADMDSYGTAREIYLKNILNHVNTLRQYFDEFQVFPILFKVDRSKIRMLYSEQLSEEEYFKYHYDNFVIRILTSIDLWGKIGCAVHQLVIKNNSWYRFAHQPKIKESETALHITEFADYLGTLRKYRHAKVHGGKSEKNEFEKVVYWQEWFNQTSIQVSESEKALLNEMTDNDILGIVKNIDKIIHEVIHRTFAFLDTLTSRMNAAEGAGI